MTKSIFDTCTRLGVQLAAAAATVTLVGCASVGEAPPPAPQRTAAGTAKCENPTATSTAKVLAAAAIGHALDKKTGGGNGFEKASGKLADELAHGCPATPSPK